MTLTVTTARQGLLCDKMTTYFRPVNFHLTAFFLDGTYIFIPVQNHFVDYILSEHEYLRTPFILGLCEIYYPGDIKQVEPDVFFTMLEEGRKLYV